MEIGLSGSLADQKLRGRVLAGFERPASMLLNAVAPFGQPLFILAARGGSGSLLLPGERRIVRDAAPSAILEALTGVSLEPDDLQAVFTGCVLPAPRATAGRMHAGGLVSIDIENTGQGPARTATLYLRRSGAQWQLRAARRDRWQIEYVPSTGAFPQSVRLTSTNPDVRVDINAALSQVVTNQDLPQTAFRIDEPNDVMPMTVEELRRSGPLRDK